MAGRTLVERNAPTPQSCREVFACHHGSTYSSMKYNHGDKLEHLSLPLGFSRMDAIFIRIRSSTRTSSGNARVPHASNPPQIHQIHQNNRQGLLARSVSSLNRISVTCRPTMLPRAWSVKQRTSLRVSLKQRRREPRGGRLAVSWTLRHRRRFSAGWYAGGYGERRRSDHRIWPAKRRN
jgi:hypothetical protein